MTVRVAVGSTTEIAFPLKAPEPTRSTAGHLGSHELAKEIRQLFILDFSCIQHAVKAG